jgi:Protein of unknown function (DUF3159)
VTEPHDEVEDIQDAIEEVTAEIADDSGLISQALGGWRGMLDSGAPSVAFLIAYLTSGHNLTLSLKIAIATGVILAAERLIRRKPLQQVLSGAAGLAVSAYITAKSGQAQNFFLPGILTNLGYFVLCLASIVLKKPVLGFMVAGLKGQDMSWTKDPAQYRTYSTLTLLWVFIFGLRVLIMLPLYLAGAVGALGVVKLVMSWPLYLLGIYISSRILKNAKSVSA